MEEGAAFRFRERCDANFKRFWRNTSSRLENYSIELIEKM